MSAAPDHDAPVLRPLPRNTIVPVAGVSHHQDVAARVQIGDEVTLSHDQANPFDVDAVDIHTTAGERLGSIPAKSGLNSRLLVGHRGGIWRGVVVDKVGSDPVGVRVKITELVGHRPAGFGADLPGRRGPVAEPVVEVHHDAVHTPGQVAPAHGGVAVAVARLVRTSSSGRVLGEYVDTVSGKVRVRGTTGTITAYPAAVVRIDDPA